jgi:hypothetical protein
VSRTGRLGPARRSAGQRRSPSRSHSSSPRCPLSGGQRHSCPRSRAPATSRKGGSGSAAPRRRFGIRRQEPIEFLFPSSQLRARLHLALEGKRRLLGPKTFRTVLRDSLRLRAISLIDSPWTKCSRRVLPIVSTTSIPHRPLRRITDEGAQLSERPLERPLEEARVVGQKPRRSSRLEPGYLQKTWACTQSVLVLVERRPQRAIKTVV